MGEEESIEELLGPLTEDQLATDEVNALAREAEIWLQVIELLREYGSENAGSK